MQGAIRQVVDHQYLAGKGSDSAVPLGIQGIVIHHQPIPCGRDGLCRSNQARGIRFLRQRSLGMGYPNLLGSSGLKPRGSPPQNGVATRLHFRDQVPRQFTHRKSYPAAPAHKLVGQRDTTHHVPCPQEVGRVYPNEYLHH